MNTDEAQIRQLVDTWLRATKAGDVDTVLDLLTEDVVFLVPGQPPMDKAAFAAASRAQSGPGAPNIDGISEIEELQVFEDWAYMRSRLKITISPPNGAAPMQRAGYTLTILRKQNGEWRLARDANLLAPVPNSAAQ